jgi:hypothetical protein
MNKLVDWRRVLWSRRQRAPWAGESSGAASVLSRERVRELEQPTYLRRNLMIAGLPGAGARRDPGRAGLNGL